MNVFTSPILFATRLLSPAVAAGWFAALLLAVGSGQAMAQELPLPPLPSYDAAGVAIIIAPLARAALAQYHENNREAALAMSMRLQAAAADMNAAAASLRELRELRVREGHGDRFEFGIASELYIDALTSGGPLPQALERAFARRFDHTSDAVAREEGWRLAAPLAAQQAQLQQRVAALKGKTTISVSDALNLVRFDINLLASDALTPQIAALNAADDARRYVIQRDVQIRTPEGVTLSAVLVRQRSQPMRAPTALLFNVYADTDSEVYLAKNAAIHGYNSVVADARGKRLSRDTPIPFEVEAKDTYAVIDWIGHQPWSDGQVGMYGGSYSGFAQWAAAKTLHPALKTIVPYVANNPGQGLPMENNVFLFSNYAWNFYVTDNPLLDEDLYDQNDRWDKLQRDWYFSGRPYADLDRIDGRPNPLLHRQLTHPGYDGYWQSMTPYGAEFARINIPVLALTGYFEDNLPTAQFFADHTHNNPHAAHYLVVGPYTHFGIESDRKPEQVGDYRIDPVAQFETSTLTFQWLDYVMRHGPKPAFLADRVNFEIMGANEWWHAPTLAQLTRDKRTLYLVASGSEGGLLSPVRPARAIDALQMVDFTDRGKMLNLYPESGPQNSLNTGGALKYVSAPFAHDVVIAGRLSGELKAMVNKRDFDFTLALYEVMPDGRYFNLSYFLGGASYAHDWTHRELLTPGRIASLPFDRTPYMGRKLAKGSRLLLLLGVNKNAFAEVNYGSGKDVALESVADAGAPMQVHWYSDSFIRVPLTELK